MKTPTLNEVFAEFLKIVAPNADAKEVSEFKMAMTLSFFGGAAAAMSRVTEIFESSSDVDEIAKALSELSREATSPMTEIGHESGILGPGFEYTTTNPNNQRN